MNSMLDSMSTLPRLTREERKKKYHGEVKNSSEYRILQLETVNFDVLLLHTQLGNHELADLGSLITL